MAVEIRDSLPKDAGAIRAVHVAAFPTRVEADLVERLTDDGDDEISLVAEQSGGIVGHILLSRMTASADGEKVRALGLAPVAVVPDRQARELDRS